MSIRTVAGALAAIVPLGGPRMPSASAREAIMVGARSIEKADTFPTFDRVLQLEQTSETSANVRIGD
jgi:hypothetical protein